MDESFFLQQLNETPGDVCLLRQYAAWLSDLGDGRGKHLLAELNFQAAREVLVQAEENLGKFRGSRPQDFEWLNSVNPMVTRAPITGRFYASPASGQAPFVQVGDFCGRMSVVGIIESQKVFFQIPAGHSGLITEICAVDGSNVVAGDPLFRLCRPQQSAARGARIR